MDLYRKTAVIVGVLFIIATVTALVTIVFLGDSLDPAEYLTRVATNETNMILAVIFWIILAISVTGIGVMVYPVIKRYHEGIALGYVGFRLIESMCIIIASISVLSLLTISKEYVGGTGEAMYYQPVGSLLLALQEWSFEIGTLIFLGLGGLFLYYPLYKLRLVPSVLSLWGLIGAACVLLYGMLSLFGLGDSTVVTVLVAPIAVQEMVFAVWLIVKGFRPQQKQAKGG
ncbi:MAG: DUF4386 domain-containing protein [Candidatus Thermoplasmatota archaeon]|nr:DUF4386 domain-containing protein [Candidatus Thermoplasmatota archaeon]